MNSKRAMEKLLKPKPSICEVPIPEISKYFHGTMNKEYDVTEYASFLSKTMGEVTTSSDSSLVRGFTPKEVMAYLSRTHNSAPGEDGIRYAALKHADPNGEALCAIYNSCLKARKVPTDWKKAEVILLHKKGDANNLDNWRPIALSCTIYKVYTGMLASRLMHYCTEKSVISHCQKVSCRPRAVRNISLFCVTLCTEREI